MLFSVEEFDKSITIAQNESVHLFFEHLKFDDLNSPVVDRVALGRMMNFVDGNDRWVYHGSLTAPPCNPTVYWNVINYIFPIKLVEYKRLVTMMEAKKSQVGSLNNNRPIQKVVNQNI